MKKMKKKEKREDRGNKRDLRFHVDSAEMSFMICDNSEQPRRLPLMYSLCVMWSDFVWLTACVCEQVPQIHPLSPFEY